MAAQDDWQQQWNDDIRQAHPRLAERPYARYARLSKAPDGSLEKVDAQLSDLDRAAARSGIPVADEHVYVDNNLSAWKRGVVRPGWDRMMEAARAGRIAGILVVALDRFTRRPADLEAMIELAAVQGLVIDGPRSGRIDLTTAMGQQQARWMAMQAAAESGNTSERIKVTLARKMREGKPMGAGRIFGFEVGGQIQRPAEVEVVRRAARRLLLGHPLQTIAAQLNAEAEEGLAANGLDPDEYTDRTAPPVLTANGSRWTGANLGRLLALHRYGGYVTHNRPVDADRPNVKAKAIVGRIPGDPVLDQETYERVQAKLASRRRGARLSGRFLLTGLAVCGRCGRTLNGHAQGRKSADGSRPRRYTCMQHTGGCMMTILAEPVEAAVREKALELLSDPDTLGLLSAEQAARNAARAAAQAAVDALDEELADLEVKHRSKEIRDLAYNRSKPVLDKRMAKALAALAEFGEPDQEARTSVPQMDPADWDDLAPEAERAMIERLRLRITVHPHPAGAPRNVYQSQRVEIV